MENYSDKLRKILAATGWSQEALAGKLGVSFVSLNSWINQKSEPRDRAKQRIDVISVEVLGADIINKKALSEIKTKAIATRCSVNKLLNNRELLEKLTTSLTYHNNATEGSTMTEADVAAVIFDNQSLRNRTAVEQREAINHQTALYFLLNELSGKKAEFKFTPELVKATHLRMMNGIITDAGIYRNHSVRIHGAFVSLANFMKIPELIENWCNLVNEETTDKVQLLAASHAMFEKIHPFSDGNGRTGRLLLFVLALRLNLAPPILKKDFHLAYYKYFELAQMHEETDPLELFIAKSILDSAEIIANETL